MHMFISSHVTITHDNRLQQLKIL